MFLLKPHVTGPEGQVTTPDVIVDCLWVDGQQQPLNRLTHQAWQQVGGNGASVPGYALMALGGGALILPIILLDSDIVVAARCAWRLNNLDDHIAAVTLNEQPLADVGLPSTLIDDAGGTGDALPRGYLLVRTLKTSSNKAVLSDPVRNRELVHRIHADTMDDDRWGAQRPRPRYSVGPTQTEVAHYI